MASKKLKESSFKGKEMGGDKNRGVSKPSMSGPNNAAPANAKNSASPSGNKNLLKKIRGSNAFKSGNSSNP